MDLTLHGRRPTKQFVLDRWFQKLPNALVATSLNHFHVVTKEDVPLQPQHSDPQQTSEEQRLTAPSLQEHKGCTLPRDEGQKKLPRKAFRMLSNAFAKVTIDELQTSDSNAKIYKKPKKKRKSTTEQRISESTHGRASTGVEDSGGRHVHKRRRLRGTKKSRREAAAKWREHFAQRRRREKEIFAALPPPTPGRYSLRSQALLKKCETDERLLQGLGAHPQVLAMRQRAPQERHGGSSTRDTDTDMMEEVVFEEC